MQLKDYVKICKDGANNATHLLNIEFEASGRGPSESDIPNAVAASMILSLDYIRNETPRAAEIFSLMAFFDRDTVPADLLLRRGEPSTSWEFIEAIGRLQAFSLISKTVTGDSFEMHSLVHMIIYQWLFTNNIFEETAAEALDILCNAFPENPEKVDRIELDKYLPHARKYLYDHINSKRDITEPLFLLTRKVAEHLRYQGREIKAKAARAAALRMAKRLFEPGSSEVLRASFCLAEAFKGLRRYRKAKRLCLRIIRTSKELRLENRTYINTLTLLSQIYTEQHKPKRAKYYNQLAKDRSVKYLGETDRDTIAIDFQTAAILRIQNQLGPAEELLRKAVEKLGKLSEHEYLLGMQHLARVVADRGCLRESEKINTRIVDLKTKALGANHVETLQATRNLAICYVEQNRFKDAKALMLDLAKRCKVLGENHPDSLRTMQSLANVYFHQDRLEEAESLQKEIYPKMLQIFGEEHAETLDHMMNTARTYASLNRSEEAAGLQLEVLNLSRETLGDKHLSTVAVKSVLAATYFDQDTKILEEMDITVTDFDGDNERNSAADVRDGRDELEELWPRSPTCSDKHVQSVYVMEDNKGRKRSRSFYGNKLENAVTLMCEVLDTRRKKCGDHHPDTLTAMYNLGVTWKEMKRTKDAMDLLRECVEGSEQEFGMDHPITKARRDSLYATSALMLTPSASIPRAVQTVDYPRPEQHLTYETPRSTPPKDVPTSAGPRSPSAEGGVGNSPHPKHGKETPMADYGTSESTAYRTDRFCRVSGTKGVRTEKKTVASRKRHIKKA